MAFIVVWSAAFGWLPVVSCNGVLLGELHFEAFKVLQMVFHYYDVGNTSRMSRRCVHVLSLFEG